jgi:hypothetical protein
LGNIIRARGKRRAGDVAGLTERLSGLKTGQFPVKAAKSFDFQNLSLYYECLRSNGRKAMPQGLKPDLFSIIYGPTKVVP